MEEEVYQFFKRATTILRIHFGKECIIRTLPKGSDNHIIKPAKGSGALAIPDEQQEEGGEEAVASSPGHCEEMTSHCAGRQWHTAFLANGL